MSWRHPSLLPSRSSVSSDSRCWPMVTADRFLPILVADLPHRYPGDCPVHTLTNNISLVLIRVLAMLVSSLSFSADDSLMHTSIRLCALVLCICADFIGYYFLAHLFSRSFSANYQAKIIWLWIWSKSSVNTSPLVLEYERFILRNSINPKLTSSNWCKLLHCFNLFGDPFS
jgi:hypothetical protein